MDNQRLVSINPYFNVREPSRFFDPAQPDVVGRPMDVCYELMGNRAARGGTCDEITGERTIQGIAFDDPRTGFKGAVRDFDINSFRISNEEGPEIWYTDPLGLNAQTSPFPGSIRQWIAKIDNTRGGADLHGPRIGKERNHAAPSVHPPN